MGTCMSRKAGKDQFNIYTTSPAWEKNYSTMDNGEVNQHKETTGLKRGGGRRALPRYTKGEATLFGFKRRSNPSPTEQVTDQVLDNNPSPEEIEPRAPTPRLPRASSVTAKRETSADGNANSRPAANRFGFRATSAPATNRVADSNANNVVPRPATAQTSAGVDTNRNRPRSGIPQPPTVASRFTLQTSHLPKPQFPIRLLAVDDTKGAKTLLNTNRKTSAALKDNKDSGVSSHIEILEKSPSMQRRRVHKPRPLEVVVNGKFFDVREATTVIRDEPNVITEISRINLPTAAPVIPSNKKQIINIPCRGGGIPIPQPRFQRAVNSSGQSTSTTSSEGYPTDEGLGEEEEEKAFRDRAGNEKGLRRFQDVSIGGNIREHEDEPEDDDWGHGEAMADEFSSHEDRFRILDSPPQEARPVMLSIEDQMFDVVAASASPTLLEDEKSPVDSLFSSPPTSTASDEENRISLMEKEMITKSANNSSDTIQEASPSILKESEDKTLPPTPPEDLTLPSEQLTSKGQFSLTPDSPGTPTNATNSLSLSEGRDFLIDDEIADQPALVFGGHHHHNKNSSNTQANSSSIITQSLDDTLVDLLPETSTPQPVPRRLGSTRSVEGSPAPVRNRRISRAGSVDTLSPCESIASDDLMLDFERSDSSAFDVTQDSLRCNGGTGPVTGVGYQRLTAAEEENLVSELESQGSAVMREWSSLLGSAAAAAHATNSLHGSNESGLSTVRPSRVLRSRGGSTGTSTPDSPRSFEPRARASPATNSPLRPRQTSLSETDDCSVRVERSTYQHMFQDIVTIKTMLLKLKRVLSENEENSLMRAETLNPFENQLKNGLLFNLASNSETLCLDGNDLMDLNQNDHSPLEELTDLRRQVVFLQQQIDDKDRINQELQAKLVALQENSLSNNTSSHLNGHRELVNAATQTERIRPVSSGPSLVQNLPSENMGPLVSTISNEQIHVPSRRQSSFADLGSITSLPSSRLPSPAPRHWRRIPSANQVLHESNIPTPKRMIPSTPPSSTTLVKQVAANSLSK